MSSQAIPLESTIIGQLKEEAQIFKKVRTDKKSRFPDKIKELSLKAMEIGLPLNKVAEIINGAPSTIHGWITEKKLKKKKVKVKPLIIPKINHEISKRSPLVPKEIAISLGILRIVLCFQ